MASLSLYFQSEANLMSSRNVIELVLQLKSAKTHGKNYITVKPHLVRHLLRNRLFYFLKILNNGFVHRLPLSSIHSLRIRVTSYPCDE